MSIIVQSAQRLVEGRVNCRCEKLHSGGPKAEKEPVSRVYPELCTLAVSKMALHLDHPENRVVGV